MKTKITTSVRLGMAASLLAAGVFAAEVNPLATAKYPWDMSAESAKDFTVNGAVKLGVAVDGAGEAARFDGGSLVLKNTNSLLKDLHGFTLRLRVKPDGKWIAGTLLHQRGPGSLGSGAFEVAAWYMPFIERNHLTFHGMITMLRGNPRASSYASINIGQEHHPVASSGWRDLVIRQTTGKGPFELYLDGKRIAVRETSSFMPPALSFTGKSSPMVIGANADGKDPFRGWIDEVALWDRALSDEELAGVFGVKTIVDAVIAERSVKKLVFGLSILGPGADPAARYDWIDKKLPAFRTELEANNPHYPRYHLTLPGQLWNPIALYHKGKYHLFLAWTPGGCGVYFNDIGEHIVWQHISSRDLIHWEILPMPIRHPDVPNENGVFFVNDKGEVETFYFGNGYGGYQPRMAVSRDSDLARWEAFPDLVKLHNVPEEYKCRHDPSAVFKKEGVWHYIATTVRYTNKVAGVPFYKAKDLINWDFAGEFFSDKTGRPINECGQLLRLNGRDVFTSIHDLAKNEQYITGTIRSDGTFEKQTGGVPDYASRSYNCVSTALNEKGQATMWRYMNPVRPYRLSSAEGWLNTYGGPRDIRLDDKGRMLVRPAPVMEKLRGKKVPLAQLKAASSEVRLQFKAGDVGETGIRLTDGKNHLDAFFDHAKQVMVLDLSGLDHEITKVTGKPDGPVSVKPGEIVALRIFSDRSVFEIYANDEIVISSQAFFHDPENLKAEIFNRNGSTTQVTVDAWEMNALKWSSYDKTKANK